MNADEVHLLICRYLQESGFQHTAFMFNNESMLGETTYSSVEVPPQSLISILKKGMLYMQLEKGINERSRTEDSADQIIGTIVDCVKRREPLPPPRPGSRPRPPPAPPPPPSPTPVEPIAIPPDSPTVLQSHFSSVYCGAFTHNGRFLATGSADATAVIWELQDVQYVTHYILDHATQQDRTGKDIATLTWNAAGTILATGCYDGTARLWTPRGELKAVLLRHTKAVFTVQFSPDGVCLLTGSEDGYVIAWAVATGALVQVFSEQHRRVLDIDWLDSQMFASASGDGTIYIFRLGQPKAVFVLAGHAFDVNKIAWDPSRTLLASCSDDKTVRVWRPFDKAVPIVLQGHTWQVYTIRWAPEQTRLLVSASFDQTARIWDVNARACLHVITRHQNPVYTIAFSPKGQYFVSAGVDNEVYVWRTGDAELVAIFKSTGGVFDALWDPTGSAIALCMTDSTVVVIPTATVPIMEK